MNETITTFKMKNGKVKSSVKPRYVETGKKGNYKSDYAKKEIKSMLVQMEFEINQSEKSRTTLVMDKHDRVSHRAFEIRKGCNSKIK